MYTEFYRGGGLLDLPLVALFLFLGAFLGVVLFATRRRDTERLARLAGLPLEEDAPRQPHNHPEGIRHG